VDFIQIFTASIESGINRYIALDPDGFARFLSIEGKIITINIEGFHQSVSLFPSADGFLLLSNFDGESDSIISGTPVALIKLGIAGDAKELLFSDEIKITGDVGLANQFNQLLSQLDIDWEEILAQNIGDIAAHKLSNVLKNINHWATRSAHSFSMDSAEYIQEEARLSPSNAELGQFVNSVDELRESADRLAARVQLLNNPENNP